MAKTEYYTRKEVMELLGFKSINAFLQLERKYPQVFLNLNPHANRAKNPWYDKSQVDWFAKANKSLKKETSP